MMKSFGSTICSLKKIISLILHTNTNPTATTTMGPKITPDTHQQTIKCNANAFKGHSQLKLNFTALCRL